MSAIYSKFTGGGGKKENKDEYIIKCISICQ
jgi:hypothetical protein